MKRTIRIILCAAAVVLATVSCQKSIEPVNPIEEGKGTIDIRVNGLMGEYTQVDGTKSELVNTVRVSWKAGDVVYVYDGAQCLGSLIASLDGTEDRYALLSTNEEHTVDAPAEGTTKLTLIHSPLLTEAPAVSDGAVSISLAEQSGAKAPFVAYATLDYTGTTITNAVVPFKFATSVIKVNCTGLTANTAIDNATLSNVNTKCKLTLSGTTAPTVSSDTNGTITRTGDEYFAANKVNTEGEAVFQIAVPKLETASGARILTVAQSSDKVKDRKFTTKSLNPATSVNTVCQLVGLPAGALAGVFTVGKGPDEIAGTDDDIKVLFSKGNLVATIDATGAPTAWKFATNQYDYIGEGGANKTIGIAAGDVDLFCWSTEAANNNWGIHTKTGETTGYTDGNFKDWGTAIDNKGTWRTLSKDEWDYLFNTRTVNGGNGDGNSYKRATINSDATSVYGMILYPDDYTGTAKTSYTSTEWETLEDADCVFLPAAGRRIGSYVDNVGGFGYYWSSTAINSYEAYNVNFFSSYVSHDNYGDRYHGFSVRLITVFN